MKTLLLSTLLIFSALTASAHDGKEHSTKPTEKTVVSDPSTPPISTNGQTTPAMPNSDNKIPGQVRYIVKGMDCEACESEIKGKVCALPTIQNCEVHVTDADKKLGEIRVTPKAGQKITDNDVKKAVKAAGKFHVKEVYR